MWLIPWASEPRRHKHATPGRTDRFTGGARRRTLNDKGRFRASVLFWRGSSPRHCPCRHPRCESSIGVLPRRTTCVRRAPRIKMRCDHGYQTQQVKTDEGQETSGSGRGLAEECFSSLGRCDVHHRGLARGRQNVEVLVSGGRKIDAVLSGKIGVERGTPVLLRRLSGSVGKHYRIIELLPEVDDEKTLLPSMRCECFQRALRNNP